MKLDKVKIIIVIVLAAITIIGTVLTVDKYFAKTEDIETHVKTIEKEHLKLESRDELVQERLDISITDDQIFQQQQQIQQMVNYHIFEPKSQITEMTPMEKEAMKNAEDRLDNLKVKKAAKIKRYEEMKKGEGK